MASLRSVRVGSILAAVGLVGVLGLGRPSAAGAEMDEATAAKLLERLKSPDRKVRYLAVRQLMLGRYRPAIPAIKKAVFDEDVAVSGAAISFLKAMGDTSLVPELIKRLETGDKASVQRAAAMLGILGDPRAAGPLFAVFDTSRDASVRSYLARALAQVADKTVIPSLQRKLAYRPQRRRSKVYWRQDGVLLVALQGMATRGVDVSEFIESMSEILHNRLIPIVGRVMAAEVLRAIGTDRATKALADAEKNADGELKKAVESARTRDEHRKKVIEAAKKRAAEAAEAAKKRAELAERDKAKAATDAAKATEGLKDADPKKRVAAAVALALTKTPAAAERIKGLLADPDPTVRGRAAELLSYPLNDATAVEPLTKLLSDPEASVRARALLSLARLQKTAARELVLKGLLDKEQTVRWAAGNGLREVGPLDASHIPILLECMSKGVSTPPRVADTLGGLGADVIAPALAYLNSSQFDKRYAGARAISALFKKEAVSVESLRAAGPGLLVLARSKDVGANRLATDLLAKVDPGSHKIHEARKAAELLTQFNRTPLLERGRLMRALGVRGNSRAIAPIASTIDGLLAHSVSVVKAGQSIGRHYPVLHRGYIASGIEALGNIGGPAAVVAIRRYLKMDDKTIRPACFRALGSAGDRTAMAELRPPLFKDKYEAETLAAAEALANLGDMQSLKRILEIAATTGRQGYRVRSAFAGFFGPATSPADQEARGKWRHMVRMQFSNVPLRDVLQFISNVSGVIVVVNWRELASLGVNASDGVSPPSAEAHAGYALVAIFAKGSAVDKLGFRLINGVLYVTSAKHLARMPSLDQRAWNALAASTQAALMKPVKLTVKAIPFRLLFEYFAQQSGVKIALADGLKTKAGLDPDAKIDLALAKLPLRDVMLLVWIHGGATVNLAMCEQDGTIIVGQRTGRSTAVKPTGDPTTKPPVAKPSDPAQLSAAEKLAANKLKLADLYKQAGRLDKAKQTYQAIIKDYPRTQTAATAKGRLESMDK